MKETKTIKQPNKSIITTKTYLKCSCICENNYKNCDCYEPSYYTANKDKLKNHKKCRFLAGAICMYFEIKS